MIKHLGQYWRRLPHKTCRGYASNLAAVLVSVGETAMRIAAMRMKKLSRLMPSAQWSLAIFAKLCIADQLTNNHPNIAQAAVHITLAALVYAVR